DRHPLDRRGPVLDQLEDASVVDGREPVRAQDERAATVDDGPPRPGAADRDVPEELEVARSVVDGERPGRGASEHVPALRNDYLVVLSDGPDDLAAADALRHQVVDGVDGLAQRAGVARRGVELVLSGRDVDGRGPRPARERERQRGQKGRQRRRDDAPRSTAVTASYGGRG